MGVCQSTQVEEVHVMLSELQSGDVLLSKEPILSSPGACFMRSCLCWQTHHIGLVVNPADFPAESHLRRRHPEMEQGRTYVFHALVTGMKVWDLERYIRRIHKACVLPGEAWVRQLRPSTETSSDFRPQLIAELDAAFEELHSRPYEKNQLSTLQAFCDCAEVCGLCQAKQDCPKAKILLILVSSPSGVSNYRHSADAPNFGKTRMVAGEDRRWGVGVQEKKDSIRFAYCVKIAMSCHVSTKFRVHVYRYVCIYTQTYIHTYRHTHIHTYIHTYIHAHIHTYIPTYIHTYIHTYTYIFMQHTHTLRPTLSCSSLNRIMPLPASHWLT
ncbi:unnamed protein product [Symbiodinium necroappetens]|uniref:Uncharacterized protein n=1 Tax=Symbiodinium necroappetens TaxID=1628268 RepID=A0A812RXS4_9DINO|nr:unnamed protein product [Symbiodinium necroappetens]